MTLYINGKTLDEMSPDEMRAFILRVVHASREVKGYVTAIRGYTNIMARGLLGELSAEQKKFVEQIKLNADLLHESLFPSELTLPSSSSPDHA